MALLNCPTTCTRCYARGQKRCQDRLFKGPDSFVHVLAEKRPGTFVFYGKYSGRETESRRRYPQSEFWQSGQAYSANPLSTHRMPHFTPTPIPKFFTKNAH